MKSFCGGVSIPFSSTLVVRSLRVHSLCVRIRWNKGVLFPTLNIASLFPSLVFAIFEGVLIIFF
jgi:hypothetical protein